MRLLKEFDVDIARLELGNHDYSYKIDDEFFELFDYSLVDQGDLRVEVELEKKTSFITLNYHIIGTVKLICDRSLEPFDFELKTEDKVILKYGEEEQELTDELEIIPFNIQQVNIARHIYEFITVAIPMKKLHPRYLSEENDDQIIYTSASEEDREDSELDPRWSELKKLKNNRLN
jgi:uncharacterized metal-binding protein YceD (DUF177 family)